MAQVMKLILGPIMLAVARCCSKWWAFDAASSSAWRSLGSAKLTLKGLRVGDIGAAKGPAF